MAKNKKEKKMKSKEKTEGAAKEAIKAKSKKAVVKTAVMEPKFKQAPEEFVFVLYGGRKIKDIYELADELEKMGKETFDFHVNEFKNDFSRWIHDILDEKELAETLKEVKDLREHELAVLRHIVKKLRKKT